MVVENFHEFCSLGITNIVPSRTVKYEHIDQDQGNPNQNKHENDQILYKHVFIHPHKLVMDVLLDTK